MLELIPCTIGIADDIIVYGESEIEHDVKFITLCETARANGLKLNAKKLQFKSKDCKFFGHKLSLKIYTSTGCCVLFENGLELPSHFCKFPQLFVVWHLVLPQHIVCMLFESLHQLEYVHEVWVTAGQVGNPHQRPFSTCYMISTFYH